MGGTSRRALLSESSQTTCPHCNTSFLLGQEQMEQAGGKVRCGKIVIEYGGEISGDMQTLSTGDADTPNQS